MHDAHDAHDAHHDLAIAIAAARARHRTLVDRESARRLHAAIDLATHRLAKPRR